MNRYEAKSMRDGSGSWQVILVEGVDRDELKRSVVATYTTEQHTSPKQKAESEAQRMNDAIDPVKIAAKEALARREKLRSTFEYQEATLKLKYSKQAIREAAAAKIIKDGIGYGTRDIEKMMCAEQVADYLTHAFKWLDELRTAEQTKQAPAKAREDSVVHEVVSGAKTAMQVFRESIQREIDAIARRALGDGSEGLSYREEPKVYGDLNQIARSMAEWNAKLELRLIYLRLVAAPTFDDINATEAERTDILSGIEARWEGRCAI